MTPDPRWQTVREALGQFSFQATNPYLADEALAALDSLEAEMEAVGDESLAAHARAEKAEAERDRLFRENNKLGEALAYERSGFGRLAAERSEGSD